MQKVNATHTVELVVPHSLKNASIIKSLSQQLSIYSDMRIMLAWWKPIQKSNWQNAWPRA